MAAVALEKIPVACALPGPSAALPAALAAPRHADAALLAAGSHARAAMSASVDFQRGFTAARVEYTQLCVTIEVRDSPRPHRARAALALAAARRRAITVRASTHIYASGERTTPLRPHAVGS